MPDAAVGKRQPCRRTCRPVATSLRDCRIGVGETSHRHRRDRDRRRGGSPPGPSRTTAATSGVRGPASTVRTAPSVMMSVQAGHDRRARIRRQRGGQGMEAAGEDERDAVARRRQVPRGIARASSAASGALDALDDPPCLSGLARAAIGSARNPPIDRADRNAVVARTGQVAVGRNARTRTRPRASRPRSTAGKPPASGLEAVMSAVGRSRRLRGLAEPTLLYTRLPQPPANRLRASAKSTAVYKGSCRHFRLCRVKARSYDASGWEKQVRAESRSRGRPLSLSTIVIAVEPAASCCGAGMR